MARHRIAYENARTVLVTGAANGIGRATVRYLAEHGDRVFAADVDVNRLALLAGTAGITTLCMDVTDTASVHEAIRQVEVAAGGLDGLVNCAGIIRCGPLAELPEEDMRHTLDVNVLGTFRVTQACFPLLLRSKGRIVNISSEVARLAGPFVGPYTMSKYAIEAYSDTLRREVMFLGLTVVLVQPGAIRTDLVADSVQWLRRSTPGSRFGPQLTRIAAMADQEQTKAIDPDLLARVIYKVLHTRHPRRRYRVHNDPFRALLGFLPAGWTDAIIRRIL